MDADSLPPTLTDTQRNVLRMLARAPNSMDNLGGNGRGPILSAARALERKGVVTRMACSTYAIKREYREAAAAELARWRAEKAAAQDTTP